MKISIITVVKNMVNTIERTIKSVISQKGVELDYIIIDGGSTDGTVDIVKKYESYIAYWVSEQDNSAVEAQNKGLAHATGEIVGMCNGDDWYADGILAHVVKTFEEGADAAYGDLVLLDKDGKPYFTCTEPQNGIEWPAPVLFVRRKLLEKIGGISLSYKWIPDWALCMEMMLEGVSAVHVPYDCAYFSWGGVSTDDKHIWRFLREYIRLREEYLPKFAAKGIPAPDLEGQVNNMRSWAWGIFIHRRCLQCGFSYADIVMREQNKNSIAIWGAGNRGKMCLKWLGRAAGSVSCFIDSNPKTPEIDNVPVYGYEPNVIKIGLDSSSHSKIEV